MSTLDARAQALLDDFAKQPGVKPGMVDDMRAAMQTSPVLHEELAATLASDPSAVRAIRLAPAGTNAGGFYDATKGTIHILDENFDRGARKDPERVDLITGVMAHELGHAQRRQAVADAGIKLDYEVSEALREVQAPQLDLTSPFARYLGAMKGEEAQAEMLGINAVSSRVTAQLGPNASEAEVLGRIAATTSCVIEQPNQTFGWADGLQVNDQHQIIGRTPQNLAETVDGFRNTLAMAECFASHAHKSLGAGGQSNYASYYGTYVVGVVQEAARDLRLDSLPPIALDFKALGIDAAQLESNRPHLAYGPMVLVDTSDGQQRAVALRGGPAQPEAPDNPRPTMAIRDPALLETLQGHCAALGQEHGWSAEHVNRASSALYAQCQAESVTRIGGVTFGIKGSQAEAGDNLWAYGRQPNGVDDRVYVGTREAMATPADESLKRAHAIKQQQALEQQQYHQQQQQTQQQAGPSLTL